MITHKAITKVLSHLSIFITSKTSYVLSGLSYLDDDVPHASVALEQLLNVAIPARAGVQKSDHAEIHLPDIFGEVTNVHLGHTHRALYLI